MIYEWMCGKMDRFIMNELDGWMDYWCLYNTKNE